MSKKTAESRSKLLGELDGIIMNFFRENRILPADAIGMLELIKLTLFQSMISGFQHLPD